MRLVRHTFVITGVSPLMMANPQDMLDEGATPVPTHSDRAAKKAHEAERLAYRLPDGQLYGPAVGLRNALLKAAIGRKFTMGKKKVSAPGIVAGSVFNVHDRCLLVHPRTGEPIHEYVIDSRRAVNKSTGGAIIVHRPTISEWQTEVTMEVDEDLIEVNNILELFEVAGCIAGWMAFRPEKKGPFGRFTAALKAKHVDRVKAATKRNERLHEVVE